MISMKELPLVGGNDGELVVPIVGVGGVDGVVFGGVVVAGVVRDGVVIDGVVVVGVVGVGVVVDGVLGGVVVNGVVVVRVVGVGVIIDCDDVALVVLKVAGLGLDEGTRTERN